MTTLSALITSVITWALTGLTKNVTVTKYADNRVVIVRVLAAVFAILSAVCYALLNHSAVDSGVIATGADALVAWLASMGIYHAPKPA